MSSNEQHFYTAKHNSHIKRLNLSFREGEERDDERLKANVALNFTGDMSTASSLAMLPMGFVPITGLSCWKLGLLVVLAVVCIDFTHIIHNKII